MEKFKKSIKAFKSKYDGSYIYLHSSTNDVVHLIFILIRGQVQIAVCYKETQGFDIFADVSANVKSVLWSDGHNGYYTGHGNFGNDTAYLFKNKYDAEYQAGRENLTSYEVREYYKARDGKDWIDGVSDGIS